MGRVFDALQQAKAQGGRDPQPAWDPASYDDSDLRHRTHTPEPVPGNAGILALNANPENRLVVLDENDSPGAERFRFLASQLAMAQKSRLLKTVLITSSATGEGKSVISANLALSMAKYAGQHTLLVDGDPRHASLTGCFSPGATAGVAEWLREPHRLSGIAKRHAALPFWFLPASRSQVTDPRLQSDALLHALSSVAGSFESVIIDSPPLVLADAAIWMAAVEGCLLVSRQGKTSIKEMSKALTLVPRAKLLGVILNDWDDYTHKYYHQYYRAKAQPD